MKFPLDLQKNNGITAAGIASFKGNLDILRLLHDAGANINFSSKNGISPLYLAIKSCSIDCIQYMLEHKVDVYFEDPAKSDSSPLFFCIK